MRLRLDNAVVVITGASSGIGRATAHAFARKGATVVLAARRANELERAAEECRELGAQALAIPADVTDPDALERVARMATETFGRLDVWVNNAAVTMFARLEQAPMEEFRRVIETNLFGYVYGTRVALPRFREQGSGVLINNASLVARVSQPYTNAYVISKQGVRALGMSLRQELALEGAGGIHVCTVLPASIDTPLFQHAANYTGRAAKAMPPVYPAERVARAIVRLAMFPRREVYVGNSARVFGLQQKLAPGLTERVMATMTDKTHLYRERPAPPTSGNLFEPPSANGSIDGGWGGRRGVRARRGATAALALGGVALLRARRD